MKTIPLTKGYVTLVDDDVIDDLSSYKFYVNITGNGRPEAVTRINGRKISLSRLLLNPLPGFCVDHINRKSLDNRISNLRICTRNQNDFNRGPKNNRLYKGISWHRNKFRASISINKKHITIGFYESMVQAALAYDRAARKYFGEFAYLNFPTSIKQEDVRKFLMSLPEKIFRIVFIKRTDGQVREMLCRKGVNKFVTGEGMRFDPSERDLLSVYDIENKGYRFIPLEAVLAIKALGEKYYIYN